MCVMPARPQWLRLTLASQESTVLAEDRPWQFDTVWDEHLDGKVIGHYAISSQGARIYGFSYTNARTGQQTAFGEDVECDHRHRLPLGMSVRPLCRLSSPSPQSCGPRSCLRRLAVVMLRRVR